MSYKKALCMLTESTPFHLATQPSLLRIPAEFFEQPTSLRGRFEVECCEQDEAYKQLLPYCVLRDPDGLIYTYLRGDGGAENRLHGALSVGGGGHVDTEPRDIAPLEEHLGEECERELEEEFGLPQTHYHEFRGLICDPTNPVGRVHLGLLSVRDISVYEKACMQCEPKVIEKGAWHALDTLLQPAVFERLENWSKVAVAYLAKGAYVVPAVFSPEPLESLAG